MRNRQAERASRGRRPPSSGRRMTRRVFTTMGLGSLGAVLLAAGGGLLRFLFPRILYEPPSRFTAGDPEAYRPGEIETRWVKGHRVWIVREKDSLYGLLAECTHLGCTPSWFPEEELFKCPCHGSNFSRHGDPVAGPAPSPLYRVALSRAPDGQLIVDKALRENRPGRRDKPPFILEITGRSPGDQNA